MTGDLLIRRNLRVTGLRAAYRAGRINLPLIKTLVADPPWKFEGNRRRGGAGRHYTNMKVEDIMAFPLMPLEDDARLFLWRVGAMQEEALAVIRAWGFTLKSELVWIKTTIDGRPLIIDENGDIVTGRRTIDGRACKLNNLGWGMGFQTRYAHETCLIATRGNPERTAHIRSVFFAPIPRLQTKFKKRIHSRKPAKFYRLVEQMSPGPYHEMFARVAQPGWTAEGDEFDLKEAA